MADQKLRITSISYKKSGGAVLMMVLIFCLIATIITQSAFEIGLLQIKMANNFKEHNDIKLKAQVSLDALENEIDNWPLPKFHNIKWLQFVPDTLAYSQTQGVHYYQITSAHKTPYGDNLKLISTFCARSMDDKQELLLNDQKLKYINNKYCSQDIIDLGVLETNSESDLLVVAYDVPNKKRSSIAFVRFPQEETIKIIELHDKISSKLLFVDSTSTNKADFIFFGTHTGALFSIDMRSPLSTKWPLVSFKDLFEGKLIGNLLVSHHLDGMGLLLYCLVENQKHETSVHTFLKTQNEVKLQYTLAQQKIGQPLIWHGFLLAPINDVTLGVYDAFTGETLKLIELTEVTSHSIPQKELMFPQVVISHPLDKAPQVIVQTTKATKICEAPILTSRLGRKTWTIK
ncbi:MAG: hypothetical protein AB7V32_02180 [Candidatus Berkiella sp.]